MTPCSPVVNANFSESQILFYLEDGNNVGSKPYCVVRTGNCGLTLLAGMLFLYRNHLDLKMKPSCSPKASWYHEVCIVPDVLRNRGSSCFIFSVEVSWTLRTKSISSSKCLCPYSRLYVYNFLSRKLHYSFILQSVLWQVLSTFQSQFPTECDLVLPLQFPVFCLSFRSSHSCVRLFLVFLSLFPLVICFTRRLLPKIWPVQLSFHLLLCLEYSFPLWRYVTLLHFSHDRTCLYSPSFSGATFTTFSGISNQLSDMFKFQHLTKLCSSCSTFVVSSLNLSRIFLWKVTICLNKIELGQVVRFEFSRTWRRRSYLARSDAMYFDIWTPTFGLSGFFQLQKRSCSFSLVCLSHIRRGHQPSGMLQRTDWTIRRLNNFKSFEILSVNIFVIRQIISCRL
jgi:hypothetical protein